MSTAVASQQIVTPEDLLAMPDSKSYELVDGQLLERHMGVMSSLVGTKLVIRLGLHCERHALGQVWGSDNGYQCFPHEPARVRKPDVSFIRNDRLSANHLSQGWCKIPPDLAVEVISPNDLVSELEDKLDDYRSVQISLIWVIYPERRTAWIHRANGSSTHLRENDEISGEEVIPGFRCPLSEIFPPQERPA
jgi:Uma2 family endonuclease